MKRIAFAAAIALVSATACAQTGSAPPAAAASAAITELVKKDSKIGEGPLVDKGKAVLVSYTGWFYDPKAPEQKGAKFDSSEARVTPLGFVVGAGRVIKGWDEGVPGMKEGGKRTLIIPPELGYGAKGSGEKIPPNSTLLFEIEILKVLN